MNYGFASGNDPSSDHRNNTELKTKGKRQLDNGHLANDKDRPTNVASKLSYLGVESLSDAVEPLDLCQGLPECAIVLAPKIGVKLIGPKRNWAARFQDLGDPFKT